LNTSIDARLKLITANGSQHLLKGGLKGLEKESLRVTPSGRISQKPHPIGLGSALKHPHITTDYSEALLELITPPFRDAADALDFLDNLHRFVFQHLDDELLWAASMPCEISGDGCIPIAYYGTSNSAKMKQAYRHGLSWRYGRAMQAIAGIHFNYSVNEALWPVLQSLLGSQTSQREFINEQYFGLIRNVHRHGWLVLYLFGASPAFCKSFFAGRTAPPPCFNALDAATLSRPYATSLRMSDIGYRNDSQSGLSISFDDLDSYVASLSKAIDTPYPDYEKIGVKVNGEYRQLSANILQISNEYYSPIRPKQIAHSGERPTNALKREGIRYIELRSTDLNPTQPLGVSLSQMRFLELFLLACLLQESPPLSADEQQDANRNALSVACCGRTPGIQLRRGGKDAKLNDWAKDLAQDLTALADIFDADEAEPAYRASLAPLFQAIADPENTPSAWALADMQAHSESFQEYSLRLSNQHAANFRARPLPPSQTDEFNRMAEESLAAQRRTEASDTLSFDEYLKQYFSQGG
jgi:glutamate--cysteine ligase